MRRRILAATILSVGVALLGFGIPLAVTIANRDRDEALLELSAEAANAAVAVPGSFAATGDFPELPDPAHEIDLALYDGAGNRVAGEGPPRADDHVSSVLETGTASQNRGDLVVAIPVTHEERVVGVMRARYPTATVAARTQRSLGALAVLGAAVFSITTLLALNRSRAVAAPLRRLQADAQRIGSGVARAEMSTTGIAEIDTVQNALADAARRVDDALERERAFSADLAHQLRTPVTSLRLRLENEQLGTDPDVELVSRSLEDLDRIERTIDDLIRLARDTAPTGEPRPLATLIHDAAEQWRPRLAVTQRELELDLEAELPWVTARPEAVRQILDVLLDNARVHGAGTVSLRAHRVGGGAVLAISDEGTTVIDADAVFARRQGQGTGIGLTLARRLAEAEGLRLVVADPGPGPTLHLAFGQSAGLPDVHPGRQR